MKSPALLLAILISASSIFAAPVVMESDIKRDAPDEKRSEDFLLGKVTGDEGSIDW
jgi:uncharacterized membrane protein